MLTNTILYYGSHEELPKPLELRAGMLTMIFEPHTGLLRYIRLGDHELVRCIYGVVRDENWTTIPWQISDLKSEIGKETFQVSFNATCRLNVVDYFWHGEITGEAGGRIIYTFDGVARSTFL